MNFTVEIGDKEKSTVEYSRNWLTGEMSINVDGEEVAGSNVLSPSTHFSVKKVNRHEFTVGKDEKHDVVIEEERPWIAAAFRKWTFRVFVDGDLFHEEVGQ